MPRRLLLLALGPLILCSGASAQPNTAEDYRRHARRAVPRDAFPVLTLPAMSPAASARSRSPVATRRTACG